MEDTLIVLVHPSRVIFCTLSSAGADVPAMLTRLADTVGIGMEKSIRGMEVKIVVLAAIKGTKHMKLTSIVFELRRAFPGELLWKMNGPVLRVDFRI